VSTAVSVCGTNVQWPDLIAGVRWEEEWNLVGVLSSILRLDERHPVIGGKLAVFLYRTFQVAVTRAIDSERRYEDLPLAFVGE
jgi:hypothetical protein